MADRTFFAATHALTCPVPKDLVVPWGPNCDLCKHIQISKMNILRLSRELIGRFVILSGGPKYSISNYLGNFFRTQ